MYICICKRNLYNTCVRENFYIYIYNIKYNEPYIFDDRYPDTTTFASPRDCVTKVKFKLDNDTKKYRLIKARDLQPYEEAASLHITPTHRRMKILLNIINNLL